MRSASGGMGHGLGNALQGILTIRNCLTMDNGRIRKRDSARLVWDSKPRRAPNPKDIEFQTAEVVILNPVHRGQLPLSFKDGILGEADIDKQKMNRLIWGDNLLAMQALLAQGYEGKINLIYIDPPFDSKADYSHKMTIPTNPSGRGQGEGLEFTKEPSVIERLAYKDTWAGGTDSYLDMLYPRLQLMKRLLAEDGSIYVHTDWHVGHYVKVLMDEVFGKENFISGNTLAV
ncbi:MAG: site-specific DNA-methyltransferase [Thermodesulfobacteriota bacterium]